MGSPAPGEVMGITNMLNQKGGSSAPAQAPQPSLSSNPEQQHVPPLPQLPIERADSPHGSEHSKYSASAMNSLTNGRSYPSPGAMHAPMHIPETSLPHGLVFALPAEMGHAPMQQAPYRAPELHQTQHPPPPKAYPCSTCGKGFARRSDLARHERIHSNIRPHVCTFPNCGKQFIQRSALTVHTRVHTGEKPHMCERCGKPFSDSSSLARHRRIHSGSRPYKCPYADCQKTFTRRTTLTRHQNHSHTGTVEDAARATAEALARGASSTAAARAASARPAGRPDGEQVLGHMSNQPSPMTTPSPGQRAMSVSPNTEMAGAGLQHQYLANTSLPAHLRGDIHVGSPASTASSGYNNGIRPTSHPTGYGPPQTLEPSIEHSQGPGSAGGSPHMGSVGWASPSHVASPAQSNSGAFVYPDPDTYPSSAALTGQMLWNSASGPRRPGSAEPPSGSYDIKTRAGELWTGA